MTKRYLLGTILTAACLLGAYPALGDEAVPTNNVKSEGRRGPPPGGRHHGPRFTEAQRNCLEGILGRPGEGERPSHEQMNAAMRSCGVARPPRGGPGVPPPESDPSSSTNSAE